jgi:hypothetical protein
VNLRLIGPLLLLSTSVATAAPWLSTEVSALVGSIAYEGTQLDGSVPFASCAHSGECSATAYSIVEGIDGTVSTYTATATVRATATYGTLSTFAQVDAFPASNGFDVRSGAAFRDELTIFGPSSGFIRYYLRGNYAVFTDLGVNAFGLSHAGQSEGRDLYPGEVGSINYVSELYPFQHGVPFDLVLGAGLRSIGSPWDILSGAYINVQLYRLEVLDQNQRAAGARILSAANAPYAVPEPGSLALLTGGLVVLLSIRRCSKADRPGS